MPNEQTSVPLFASGEVLTAANMNLSAGTGVPVFANTTTRDAAFGGAGEKVLAEGQLCYLSSTNALQYYDGAAWASIGGMITKVERFTASGTFTPPTGVTYAIANIRAGGGATAANATPNAGGNSSVAFAGGTITATGGKGMNLSYGGSAGNITTRAGTANTGHGGNSVAFDATAPGGNTSAEAVGAWMAEDGEQTIAGGAVTAGVGITVTVGAGGAAGSAAGGSGFVSIEYQVAP